MRSLRWTFCSFLFSLLLAAPLSAAPLSYERQPVQLISIESPDGRPLPAAPELRARLRTKEGSLFSQVDFDADLKLLSTEFDRIEPELRSSAGELTLLIKVWPKPTIRSIHFSGNQRIAASTLYKQLEVPLASCFDRATFNGAIQKLRHYYFEQGSFEAQISYQLSFDDQTHQVDIDIQIEEGRSGKISKILFDGFTPRERQELLEMMYTKQYNFFTGLFSQEGLYNEEGLQHDQFIICNYLQNLGYADADVAVLVTEQEGSSDRLIVRIVADKGARYRFGQVSFRGNSILSDEQVQDCLIARPGRVYSPEALRETVSRLTDRYGRCGYIDAFVTFVPKLSADGCFYDVELAIDEGDQYRVGLIKILGNSCTQTSVILHEVLLLPGALFDSVKLRKSEERLYNMGYFKSVNVYALPSDDPLLQREGCFRDIYIEVEETSTGNFSGFMGLSTIEDVFFGFNMTERNFNYKGIGNLSTQGVRALRGAGEYLHLNFSAGLKSRRYDLSWTKPFINDTPWSFGFDLYTSSNRYISDDYDINASGLTLHGTYPYNAFVKLNTHYRLRYADVVTNEDAPKQLKRDAKNSGLISAAGWSCLYDSTDHPTEPRVGGKSRLDFEYAFLGQPHFMTFAYLNSWYIPVGEKGVLRFRGNWRFLWPLGHTHFETVPLDERFFLGGEDTVRGYRPYSLGPAYVSKDSKGKESNDPKGGISLQYYSVEYGRPLFNGRVELFAFCDGGHLSDKQFNMEGLNVSIGFGTRIKLFAGNPPVTLGMGYPLKNHKPQDRKRFFIDLGGRF